MASEASLNLACTKQISPTTLPAFQCHRLSFDSGCYQCSSHLTSKCTSLPSQSLVPLRSEDSRREHSVPAQSCHARLYFECSTDLRPVKQAAQLKQKQSNKHIYRHRDIFSEEYDTAEYDFILFS